MSQQLFFDLDFGGISAVSRDTNLRRRNLALQRAVMCWLEQEDSPTGASLDVITRISRLRADVAAFWSVPVRNHHEEGPTQILSPSRTVIVQCHSKRDECWPDCIRSQEILPQLRGFKEELDLVEQTIRKEEPRLRETDTLFEELAEWRYEDSENSEYHRLKRTIEKMEHSLYHGTKFERIRSAQLADLLYLAVPAGVVQRDELADGWGLLWVEDDLSVRVVTEADDRECLPSNRIHLVQNIAAASKNAALFAHGIRHTAQNVVTLVQPPRGHRKKQHLRLSKL